jgi:hypothetical protein
MKKNFHTLDIDKANNNNALPIHLLCLCFVVLSKTKTLKTSCNPFSIIVPAKVTKLDCKRMLFFSHTKGHNT